MFGLTVQGYADNGVDLMNVLIAELRRLKLEKIQDEELNRAKNIIKINILMAMERREERLEEVARNYMTFHKLTF